jgi:ankyrin repeat protein
MDKMLYVAFAFVLVAPMSAQSQIPASNLEQSKVETKALIAAAGKGDLLQVQQLLKRGANPNVNDDNGETPLIAAAFRDNVEVVEILIAAKADLNRKICGDGINPKSPYGPDGLCETALGIAAGWGNLKTMSALLRAGADPNLADKHGRTPLMAAANAAGKGSPSAVEILLKAGADTKRKDHEGGTVLSHARNNPEVLEVLRRYGIR